MSTRSGSASRRRRSVSWTIPSSTQAPEPYLTKDGLRTVSRAIDRFTARFRGHIQWQGFVTLCGQIGRDGIKHVTPELLRTFFNSEAPFFDRVVERRRQLREGSLVPGDRSGLLLDAPGHIDLVATDRDYQRNKSGLWLILKIGAYMLMSRRSTLGPLLRA